MNRWKGTRRALALLLLLAMALSPAALAQTIPLRSWSDTYYNLSASSYDKRKGDSGDVVRNIQRRLIDLGYLSGSVDGDYGNKTKSAVELFQRNNGIHGSYSANYGIATQMTQAVLFSDEALSYYSSPRLSYWSVNSSPYSVMKGHYINYPDSRFCLNFEMRNDNDSEDMTGIVVRYWLQDTNNRLVKYNGYECYQTTVTLQNNLAPGKTSTIHIHLAPGLSQKAYSLRWVVTEMSFANGEVYMDYDASARSYSINAYTTDIGWQ